MYCAHVSIVPVFAYHAPHCQCTADGETARYVKLLWLCLISTLSDVSASAASLT